VEFVLVFPVLLMLAAAVIWIGSGVASKARAVVEARARAWSSRHDAGLARPFDFADLGRVRAESSLTPTFRPPFLRASTPTARSSHLVLGGAWDFQDVPLDRVPDWNAAHQMLAALPGQAGDSALRAVSRIGEEVDVASILERFVDQELAESVGVFKELEELRDRILGTRDDVREENRRDTEELREKLPKQIEARDREIEGWERDLESAKKELGEIEEELDEGRDRKTGEELDEEAREGREKRREELEGRAEELEKKIKEAKSENARDEKILGNLDPELEP